MAYKRRVDERREEWTMKGVNQKSVPKVLVVEDDADVRTATVAALRSAGFLCSEAGDAARARKVIVKARPDIVILDLGLPDSDGLELLRELRSKDELPVIVISGRGAEDDRVIGLEIGADDYMTKPFSARELATRAKNVLRRASSMVTGPRISFGEIALDVDAREVRREGSLLALTAKEFDLLVFLARHPRTVFTRIDLLREVWLSDTENRSEATVTEHVRRLRLKLEIDPANPRHLSAVRGVGYRLVP